MKRRIALSAVLALAALSFAACGTSASSGDSKTAKATQNNAENATITVGASPSPHAKILEYVRDNLAKDAGLDLKIETFDDYVVPNDALQDGSLDANYFQTKPFLDEAIKERGYEFTPYEGIHIEPLGIYSKKYKKLAEVPDGATVTINNDPANQDRALELLAANDLVTLKKSNGLKNPLESIDKNPKNLKFEEIAAAQVVLTLSDADLAVINGNYALEAKLVPSRDALALENGKSKYANLLVVRTKEKDNPRLRKLDELLHSRDVRDFITKTWPDGEVLPVK